MSERNRVAPDGRIVATDVRGAWMGNRGRLHRPGPAHEIVRTHQTRDWITCVLEFRGRRVRQWDPRHYTPLFFRDEAVAFAAGHRPCAECRHASYTAYRDAWASATGSVPYARDMDDRLHAERGCDHTLPWPEVPTGAFVVDDDALALVVHDRLVGWDDAAYGYRAARRRPARGDARVRTPPGTLAVLRAGYPVQLDPSVR